MGQNRNLIIGVAAVVVVILLYFSFSGGDVEMPAADGTATEQSQ